MASCGCVACSLQRMLHVSGPCLATRARLSGSDWHLVCWQHWITVVVGAHTMFPRTLCFLITSARTAWPPAAMQLSCYYSGTASTTGGRFMLATIWLGGRTTTRCLSASGLAYSASEPASLPSFSSCEPCWVCKVPRLWLALLLLLSGRAAQELPAWACLWCFHAWLDWCHGVFPSFINSLALFPTTAVATGAATGSKRACRLLCGRNTQTSHVLSKPMGGLLQSWPASGEWHVASEHCIICATFYFSHLILLVMLIAAR